MLRENSQITVAGGSDIPREFTGLRVYLIGIGGSGMSGAAALLLERGARVSGSDMMPFDGMGALVSRGARVGIGHRAEQVDASADLVVFSAAIPASNPELVAARALGLRVVKYAELVGALMREPRKGVAIAGTHGKTTTSALCAYLCVEAGLDPSFLIGAPSQQLRGSSGAGSGPHFIVESCEFDRSFLHFAPESAAILNIEPDHFDCYADLDEIVEAFAQFAANVDPAGLLVRNAEDPLAGRAAAAASARVATFGFEEGADWQAAELHNDAGCYAFDIRLEGNPLMSTRLSIPGRHNVANALAAVALAYHAGADPEAVAEALPAFEGVSRRLTWRGEGRGVTIVDDYAHHPTEVRASLEAARHRYRPKRTWVVFQPHQRERMRRLLDDFAGSLGEADEVIVPDVYAARETDDPDHSACAENLVSRIRQSGGRVCYLPSLEAVADHLVENVAEGDLVMTMGAGDVWKVADELVERICEPNRV